MAFEPFPPICLEKSSFEIGRGEGGGGRGIGMPCCMYGTSLGERAERLTLSRRHLYIHTSKCIRIVSTFFLFLFFPRRYVVVLAFFSPSYYVHVSRRGRRYYSTPQPAKSGSVTKMSSFFLFFGCTARSPNLSCYYYGGP